MMLQAPKESSFLARDGSPKINRREANRPGWGRRSQRIKPLNFVPNPLYRSLVSSDWNRPFAWSVVCPGAIRSRAFKTSSGLINSSNKIAGCSG